MRVLMMLDWNPGQGGTERYAANMRDGLRHAGDEVRLLTSSAGTAADGTADYVAFGTSRGAAQAFLQVANPFAAATVRRAVGEFHPDLAWVISFAYHLSPAAVFAMGDLPTVLTVVDYKLDCPLGSKLLPDGSLCGSRPGWVCHREGCLSLPHWIQDWPRYARIRRSVARARRVVACSAWLRDRLAESGIQAEAVLLPVAPPDPGFARRPAAEPTFLFCGRLEREKGVDLLLRAFARLHGERPAARLRVAGSGSQQDALRGLAASLGVEGAVEFLGWLPPDRVERELASAWASVAPSLWAEPLGLVAVEAIVRGVPVIAAAAGGFCETVEDGRTGLLFSRGDEGALLDCLGAIASGGAFPLNTATTAVIERFSIGSHVTVLRRIFGEAVTPQQTSPSLG